MKEHPPNAYRIRNSHLTSTYLGTTDADGNNGAFSVPMGPQGVFANCIISDGEGWEHLSVHIPDQGKARTPTWDEMCKLKDLFWKKDEWVVQYHPAESKYVNIHPHVLHLWRPREAFLPTPPIMFV